MTSIFCWLVYYVDIDCITKRHELLRLILSICLFLNSQVNTLQMMTISKVNVVTAPHNSIYWPIRVTKSCLCLSAHNRTSALGTGYAGIALLVNIT